MDLILSGSLTEMCTCVSVRSQEVIVDTICSVQGENQPHGLTEPPKMTVDAFCAIKIANPTNLQHEGSFRLGHTFAPVHDCSVEVYVNILPIPISFKFWAKIAERGQ